MQLWVIYYGYDTSPETGDVVFVQRWGIVREPNGVQLCLWIQTRRGNSLSWSMQNDGNFYQSWPLHFFLPRSEVSAHIIVQISEGI